MYDYGLTENAGVVMYMDGSGKIITTMSVVNKKDAVPYLFIENIINTFSSPTYLYYEKSND